MRKSLLLFVGLSITQCLIGCQMPVYKGEARDVKRRPREGGVVAIPQNARPEDRERADQVMNSVCNPNPFKVVDEGETVIGQEVVSNTRQTNRANSEHEVGSLFGMPVVSGDQGGHDAASSSTTRALKEWQMSYVCEKATASAAPVISTPSTSDQQKTRVKK